MSKILVAIAGLAIFGGVVWLVVTDRDVPGEFEKQTEFKRAPDFALKDYDGKTVQFADFAGKPLVINSWAAWCPFCKKELSDFAAVQKEFGERVVIVAIDRAEPLQVAKGFTDAAEISDEMIFLLDPEDSFYRAIGGFSMPETIFVDSDGNIRDHKRGPMDLREMRERIQKLISG